MHPNEIKLSRDNVSVFMSNAAFLGPTHVQALLDQIQRQDAAEILDALSENTMSLEEFQAYLRNKS
jgi:hypothetical protein